jgi:quercetin dioxygenase-like cupin family protein
MGGKTMRVVKIADVRPEPMGEATPVPGWKGGAVTRSRQTIIPDGDSQNYRCSVVNFSQGSTTGWHAHTCDQILVITAGSGIVATEQEEREVGVGDVVHIKAGERHWHGAKADTTMSHITITTAEGESRR